MQEIREKQISAGSVDAGAGTRAPKGGQKGKILYAIGSFDLGGTEHHLCQILPLLRDRGWDVSLYCVRRRGSLAPRLTAAGIEVIAPPLESALPEAARLPASAVKLAALDGIIRSVLQLLNPAHTPSAPSRTPEYQPALADHG